MRYILIVEDDHDVSTMLEDYLRGEREFRTTHAYDGQTALIALSRRPHLLPAAAIIDMILPGISGLDIARVAIAHGVPVLLMSGYPEQISALSALDCPYLLKPFGLAQIAVQLRALIDKRDEMLARTGLALTAMFKARCAR